MHCTLPSPHSQDGRNWARIEAEHHTGALFDVGSEGEWDELFIGGPQVWGDVGGGRAASNRIQCWDGAANKGAVLLGSQPGQRRGSSLSCRTACHPNRPPLASPSAQVVAAGPRDMRMYYHSYDRSAGRFRVGLATSPDGFRWTKQGPIFEARQGWRHLWGAGFV